MEGAVFHVDMCVWPLIAVEQEVRCGSERKLGPPREPSHFRGETRPLTTLEIMLRRHFGVRLPCLSLTLYKEKKKLMFDSRVLTKKP